MDQRFTRSEVERMTGATRQQLDYWARLGLVHPRARWGERFFGFADLVAVETLRRVTARSVPAGRLRRAIDALDRQLGQTRAPLESLRIAMNGSEIIVHEPGAHGRLVEPITGQFVLNFETAPLERKVRALGGRSAEEWFEIGMASDAHPKTLPDAAHAYRQAIELSPEWVEAHINLGTALYQLERLEESRGVFTQATTLDPRNALAHFNLGCLHDRLGDSEGGNRRISRRRFALPPNGGRPPKSGASLREGRKDGRLSPASFALSASRARRGPWADFARTRLRETRGEPAGKVTPFRRRKVSAIQKF